MSGSLAPGFLIASPPLGDPNFDRTVVLLAIHGAGGSLGFVVNRPTSMTIGELLAAAGYGDGVSDATRVFAGGPVQSSSGWIVAERDQLESTVQEGGVIEVGDRVRIASSRVAFDALARDVKESPEVAAKRRRLVILGYSGWGPGQLEGEIAHGAWLPVPFDETVLFDVAAEQRWEKAYALLGLTPAVMMSMRSVGEA